MAAAASRALVVQLKANNTTSSTTNSNNPHGHKGSGGDGGASKGTRRRSSISKRWEEAFFLLHTPFWLTLCFAIVVPLQALRELYRARIFDTGIGFNGPVVLAYPS